MSKTVVVISESGRLIDVTGALKESDDHYKKFAMRLLGEDGAYAVLDYGWNNNKKLKITGSNGKQEILLDAQDVKVSGTLKINNVPLQEIINESVDFEIKGIRGTEGQIEVIHEENADYGQSDPSRNLSIIKLSDSFVQRLTSIENIIQGLFRFDEVYYAGDGLITREDPVQNTINVFIGTGLKYELKEYSVEGELENTSSSTTPAVLSKLAVAVDCDSVPTQLSVKPITSGAVFEAIQNNLPLYTILIDSTTGNMCLYNTIAHSSESLGD